MSSSEDDSYFSESDFVEPFRASAAPSHMLHDQRDPLHSDDDRQRGLSVAREQLVLSHWRELLYALAAKRRAGAPTRTTSLAPPSHACSSHAVAINDDEPAAAMHEVFEEMDESSGDEAECEGELDEQMFENICRASSTEAAASTKAEPPAKAPAAAVMPPPPPPPQQQKRRVKKVKWVWDEKKTSLDDDPDIIGQLELCTSDVKTHVKTSQQSPVVRSS